jgi:selenocysteine lyase/cysteine desulfurase
MGLPSARPTLGPPTAQRRLFRPAFEGRERLREALAALCGVDPGEVALVPSTSHGVLYIALCRPWRAGERIVLFDGEFPTNVTPWQQAAARFELECTFLRAGDFRAPDGRGLERLEATLRAGARLVAVSAVQFQTGLAMPLREMTELCHRHGAEIFVDAIQAIGGVPLDLRELGVDYAVAGSHKWLMGVEGAAMLYVRDDRVASLRPTVAGWLSHEDAARFLFEGEGHLRYDRPIRRRADFLEIGAMNTVGFAALAASVAELTELTVPAIHRWVGTILDRLEQGLCERGFTSLRAKDPARRSNILGVRPPDGIAAPDLWRALDQRGIGCAVPDGVVRFSPHWPNRKEQVDVVLAAIDDASMG